jgi:serine/threonine protein kinase
MFYRLLFVVDHVHVNKIISRDVKPENMLFQDDNIFLTDFGIAKPINTMAGTRWYMGTELC